ncbi:AfsR/SARP family transcriptional regulator [Agromyces agglutinans]|nr:BTAD domain-containing putative transcriptional regulator [Agromyces agglutinans]
MAARRVFLIAGAGAGKSSLIARAEAADPRAYLLRLGPRYATPSALAAELEIAARSEASTVLIDDAQWCAGCEAADVLERFVVDAPQRVILASREAFPFATARAEYGGTAVLGVRDLALRLDEVAAVFRWAGAKAPSSAAASRLLTETAGSPALIVALAGAVADVDRDAVDVALVAAIEGGAAAPVLDGLLDDLDPIVHEALTRASVLPSMRAESAIDLLGGAAGCALLRALDDGMVPHRLRADGARELPRMLRRHLFGRLPASERAALAADAAKLLTPADAARALADAANWDDAIDVLRAHPVAIAAPGAAAWAPPRADVVTDLLAVRALIDDREPVTARRRLDALRLDRLPPEFATIPAVLRDELDGLAGPWEASVGPTASTRAAAASTGRSAGDPTTTTRATAHRLLVGDALGATRALLRRLRDPAAAPHVRLGCRLALVVARAAIASAAETAASLCHLEAEAMALGLPGIARLARGMLAALAPESSPHAVHEVVEECELRGDDEGAAFVEAAWLLGRLHDGRAESRRAAALADRLSRLGAADGAAVASATAAYLAAQHHEPHAVSVLAAAEASALVTPTPAARAWIDAAYLVRSGDPERLAAARRAARDAGMPRLPVPLPTAAELGRRTSRAPAEPVRLEVVERIPRITVGCFGGFRLRVDGRDLDLRGVRPQARNVLRMLALNAGSPVHRELIAEVIWRDLEPTSAVHALHVSVSSLRRALGLDTADRVVARDGEAYQLRLANRRDCDLADFDANLEGAAAARRSGDATGTADGLRRALHRYVGEVLPEDGPAEWAVGARDRYKTRASEAAAALAHLELRSGDRHGALDAATRGIEIDPWHDASWRALLAVHRESGDVVATRRAEQGYRRMRVALGVD